MNHASHASLKAFGLSVEPEVISLKALMRPYGRKLGLGGLLLVATNVVMLSLPTLINAGVSLLETGKPITIPYLGALSFSNIYTVIFLIIVFAIMGAVIRTLSRIVIFDIGRAVERDIRKILFYRMSALDDIFYRKYSVGDIMNHLTSDVMNVRMLTGFAALNIMNIVIIFICNVPLLLAIDPTLALCALLPFPLMALSMSGLSKKLFEASKAYQQKLDALVSHVQENLLGAHVIRLFHKQDDEGARFYKTNDEAYEAAIAQAQVRSLLLPLMRLVMGVSITLIVWVGTLAIAKGRISAGDFVEINARILQLTWPAMSIGFVMSMYSRGSASIMRINKLLSYTPRIFDGKNELKDLAEIVVKDLKLKDGEQGISFSLKRGQILGLVGTSGSYKSTLIKALTRRFKVPSHTIFFDGHDVSDLELSSFYSLMGIMTEESTLFHKSIKDNICLLKPEASLEEILEVLRITRLDRDLLQWSEGINTIVGERGITLSGGQKQRVALARLLLVSRPLLLLDDALSAVDKETEKHIMHELMIFAKNSMMIIATHHVAALKNADHIIVLDKGAISAEGSFAYLLKHSVLFKELWGLEKVGQRHER